MLVKTLSLSGILSILSSVLSAQVFTSSNLPVIRIDTYGQTIPDEPKINASMEIVWDRSGDRNAADGPADHFQGYIGIEIRGSSSQMFPKKQYGIETRDSEGEDLNVSLFDMPEEEDWVLYAPYSDKSLIRNVLAYKLSRDMGQYASRTRLVELVLNGQYQGVYVFMEKIKRDKNRIDISKLEPDENSGDDLTGGYIIKIDKWTGDNLDGWTSLHPPFTGAWQRVTYQYDYPKPEDITDTQKQYIINTVENFELTMKSPGYSDPLTGYPSLIDVSSFVDVFLIGEVSRNVDAFRLSAYMYKDRDSKDPRFHAGPVWDYNLAFGNADYYHGWETEGFQLAVFFMDSQFREIDGFCAPFWWNTLFNDPAFMKTAAQRYFDLRQDILSLDALYADIDSLAGLLQEAQVRNFQRWPVLGTYVWPNAFIGYTYDNELNYLKSWIADRLNWLDLEFAERVSLQPPAHAMPDQMILISAFPNPFNGQCSVNITVPEDNVYSLKLYDLTGRQVLSLPELVLKSGLNRLRIDAETAGLTSGTYFLKVQQGAKLSGTEKILLIR